jgi:hypothetical protein
VAGIALSGGYHVSNLGKQISPHKKVLASIAVSDIDSKIKPERCIHGTPKYVHAIDSWLVVGYCPLVYSTSLANSDKCYNASSCKDEENVSFSFISVFQPLLEW